MKESILKDSDIKKSREFTTALLLSLSCFVLATLSWVIVVTNPSDCAKDRSFIAKTDQRNIEGIIS